MIEIFIKGGPIMWPLLLTSFITVSVVIERFMFIAREKANRDEKLVSELIDFVEQGQWQKAIDTGKSSLDFVARTLVYGLLNKEKSFASAVLMASQAELKRFSRGLSVLDTVITLAPLLGLLGTVTGMIHSFGLLGGSELEAPTAITGGIAEALIATAFGLVIAIVSLIPYNFLNARLEQARHEMEDAATRLEIILLALKK